jgi:cyclic pyranopterin monophosphate synthase
MVDVGAKPVTERRAVAEALLRMEPSTAAAVVAGDAPKGDVIGTARIAGIQAAKRTSELIPMCHPLLLTDVEVDCALDDDLPGIRIDSVVRCEAKTGAEMEALTAVAVAGLTVIDMAKSVDRWMTIEGITLVEKRGGKSGTQRRPKDD